MLLALDHLKNLLKNEEVISFETLELIATKEWDNRFAKIASIINFVATARGVVRSIFLLEVDRPTTQRCFDLLKHRLIFNSYFDVKMCLNPTYLCLW